MTGDRVDVARTPFDARRYLQDGIDNVARAGASASFVFVRADHRRTIELKAVLLPRSLADNITNILLVLADVGLTFIGVFLVLKRPSAMTWAFFFYCNSYSAPCVTVVSSYPPLLTAVLTVILALYGMQWRSGSPSSRCDFRETSLPVGGVACNGSSHGA